jgi:hypothetical protein
MNAKAIITAVVVLAIAAVVGIRLDGPLSVGAFICMLAFALAALGGAASVSGRLLPVVFGLVVLASTWVPLSHQVRATVLDAVKNPVVAAILLAALVGMLALAYARMRSKSTEKNVKLRARRRTEFVEPSSLAKPGMKVDAPTLDLFGEADDA